MLNLAVFSVFLLIIPFLLIFLFHRPRATTQSQPPSPPRLPVVGNLFQLSPLLHRSLANLAKVYGPIMLVHFGRIPTFVISSADLAREAMKLNDAVFASRPFLKVLQPLFKGKDMGFAPYGAYWRWTRRICSVHLLSAKRVQSFHSAKEEEVAVMVEAINTDRQSLDGVVDLSKILFAFSNNVLCRIVSGKFTRDQSRNREFHELITENEYLLGKASLDDALPWIEWLAGLFGRTTTIRRAKDHNRKWDAFLDKIIKEHAEKEVEEEDHGSRKEEDFVDVLLALKERGVEGDEGFVLGDEHIKALLIEMLAAGTETTYETLEWAMAEIIRKPTVKRRLQDEVWSETKKHGHNNKILTMEKLSKMSMPYLNAIIKETLRVHPVAPLLMPKETTQDCMLGGYNVPKGARVLFNAWEICRDPKYWEEPNDFNPERFLNNGIDFRGNDFQLIPFGAGRRICPGMLFASSTIELAIANLFYCFDWELPCNMDEDTMDMNELPGIITLRREKKLELVARCLI